LKKKLNELKTESTCTHFYNLLNKQERKMIAKILLAESMFDHRESQE
jgi:hypothetical protein